MIRKTNGFLEQYIAAGRSGEEIIGYELQLELDRLEVDMVGSEYI